MIIVKLYKYFDNLCRGSNMPTLLEQIQSNTLIHANFCSTSFDDEFTKTLCDAIEKNKSIQTLDFCSAFLYYNTLDLLIDTFLGRKIKLMQLNLDCTHITQESLKSLTRLINADLVVRLLLFPLDRKVDDLDKLTAFNHAAKEMKVEVSFLHPLERKDVKFSNHPWEQNRKPFPFDHLSYDQKEEAQDEVKSFRK
jgi:hypothetical protein